MNGVTVINESGAKYVRDTIIFMASLITGVSIVKWIISKVDEKK